MGDEIFPGFCSGIYLSIKMRKYNSVEDFLEDKSFRDWVLKKDMVVNGYWERYQSTHTDQADILEQAKSILLELDSSDNAWSPERQRSAFLKIKDRIEPERKDSVLDDFPVHKPKSGKWTSSVLFIFLGALLLTYINWDHIMGNEQEEPVQEEKWVVKSNPKGQKSRVYLPDGSTVVVNADSEIRFRADFGKEDRQIFLTGEAFFEVASDSLIPFQVHSGGLTTTALGTAFNIRSYDEEEVKVQLAEGEVLVAEEFGEGELLLKPGEEVVRNGKSGLKVRKFDLDKAFLWKEGRLYFQKASVDEFVEILERWYGVDIEVEGSPRPGTRITGEFKEPYLTAVLESIGYAYGFEYAMNHKKVKIKFNPK